MSLQAKIDALLKQGKRPAITLHPAIEVIMPKRPFRAGRPRVRDPNDLYARYAGRRGKAQPKCLARGCKQYLRIWRKGACSEWCADAIFNQALMLLRSIDATREEIFEHYQNVRPCTLPEMNTKRPPAPRRLRRVRNALGELVCPPEKQAAG
jgi:hypothetical protein